jgi:hypothetical protein
MAMSRYFTAASACGTDVWNAKQIAVGAAAGVAAASNAAWNWARRDAVAGAISPLRSERAIAIRLSRSSVPPSCL